LFYIFQLQKEGLHEMPNLTRGGFHKSWAHGVQCSAQLCPKLGEKYVEPKAQMCLVQNFMKKAYKAELSAKTLWAP
jgi:hypothetical protein